MLGIIIPILQVSEAQKGSSLLTVTQLPKPSDSSAHASDHSSSFSFSSIYMKNSKLFITTVHPAAQGRATAQSSPSALRRGWLPLLPPRLQVTHSALGSALDLHCLLGALKAQELLPTQCCCFTGDTRAHPALLSSVGSATMGT